MSDTSAGHATARSDRDDWPTAPGRRPSTVVEALYPEVGAGGFSRIDGNIQFFGRVNALLRPDMTVLDFGAGRGKDIEDPIAYRRNLGTLRGKCAHVIGVDIDPAVSCNESLDRAIVVGESARLPLDDCSIDLVVSDFCFEHVRSPSFVAGELDRVLKVGGWICSRTPNRWGYIGIGARSVPNRFHVNMLTHLQPSRQGRDVFPTYYLLNSRKQIRAHFPFPLYEDYTYTHNTEPAYFGNSLLATRMAKLLIGSTPDALSALLLVFLRKTSSRARDSRCNI